MATDHELFGGLREERQHLAHRARGLESAQPGGPLEMIEQLAELVRSSHGRY
ncbi:hypothetical protein D3C83_328900 [compost metagenome]